MGKIENENYYQVSGWMINELNLKGNELLIYAIIYGFTQSCNCFSGGLSYLEDFIGATKPTVILALKKLTEKGLLQKEKITTDKGICCVYKAVKNFNQGSKESLPMEVKNLYQGGKKTLPNNNIYNNTDNNNYNINKNKKTSHDYQQFINALTDGDKEIFQKCVDTLYSFRQSKDSKFIRNHNQLLKWQFDFALFSQKSDRSADEILETLTFGINDNFWSDKMYSPENFVKQYEKIRLKMGTNKTNNNLYQNKNNYFDKSKLENKYDLDAIHEEDL